MLGVLRLRAANRAAVANSEILDRTESISKNSKIQATLHAHIPPRMYFIYGCRGSRVTMQAFFSFLESMGCSTRGLRRYVQERRFGGEWEDVILPCLVSPFYAVTQSNMCASVIKASRPIHAPGQLSSTQLDMRVRVEF